MLANDDRESVGAGFTDSGDRYEAKVVVPDLGAPIIKKLG
jgi:hypothetical protein